MKIAYLHQYFVTPDMGGGTRSFELARRLVAFGHEVHMVTSDQKELDRARWREEEIEGIKVHWTPVHYGNQLSYHRRLQAFFKFAFRAARKARQIEPDVVFATSTPLTIALPAVWAARRCSVPMVFEVRDLWPEGPIAIGAIRNPVAIKAARWLERFAYRHASRVVALAPGMKDAVVETGFPAQNAFIIPNGSDVAVFQRDRHAAEAIRAEFAWLGRRPMVLYFGALGLVNGVDYLFRLAAETRKLNPEARFVVLGAGRMEDSLRELGRALEVLDNNLFMMGKVSKYEVARWLSAANISIALIAGPRVLWKDATQNKFFDSLAAGCPVANNFDGWQSQIAVEEGCGLILDPDDTENAARQLNDALMNHEWLAVAGRKARELAEHKFNRDIHARELEKVLADVVAEWQRG